MSKKSPDKKNQTMLITLSANHMLNDAYQAFSSTLAPFFVEKFALSNTMIGYTSIVQQIPSLLQLVVGRYADKVNLKYWMIFSPLVTAAAMSCLSIAPKYAIVLFLIFVSGTSSAIFHAIAPVNCGQIGKDRMGRAMSLFMVGGEFGRVIGPLMLIGAISLFSYDKLPIMMVFGFILSVIFYFLLRDLPFEPAVKSGAAEEISIKDALKCMAPIMLVILGILFMRNFLVTGMTSYLTIYQTQKGAAISLAGISLSLMQTAGAFGALFGGTISDSIGRKKTLLICFLITPIASYLFVKTPLGINLIFLLILGFTNLMVFPVILTIVQEQFPQFRAFALAILQTGNFLTYLTDVSVMGRIGDSFGLDAAFLFSAAVYILGIPLVLALPERR